MLLVLELRLVVLDLLHLLVSLPSSLKSKSFADGVRHAASQRRDSSRPALRRGAGWMFIGRFK